MLVGHGSSKGFMIHGGNHSYKVAAVNRKLTLEYADDDYQEISYLTPKLLEEYLSVVPGDQLEIVVVSCAGLIFSEQAPPISLQHTISFSKML